MKKKKIKAIARAAHAAAKSGKPIQAEKPARSGKSKEERRLRKIEQRRREKAKITPSQWAAPAPSHLVGKREVPKVKSKYQSYFEFAENTEKKKKLEFKVTNDTNPPPGFAFVPIGDPQMTNMCKDLSRTRDAMIFIVSTSREGNSRVSEHMYRTGYHFRAAIVDDARALVGETVVSTIAPGQVEPIPETQEEINKQADAAIRDLFPRIPNTDRTMIIEHAFKKGALFHGEPTVGLQDNIPLSRRVQLAVLAHIRHTHTRYDELLRETSWINARKVVEPVCLDILVKWRGDEETGRDQMDEILREVVIITDSEAEQEEDEDDDDEDSSEEDGSEEEGEVTSEGSPEVISLPDSRNQQHQPIHPEANRPQGIVDHGPGNAIATRTRSQTDQKTKEPRPRGFSRYQEVASRRWDEAQQRQRAPALQVNPAFDNPTTRRPHSTMVSPLGGLPQYSRSGSQHAYRNSDHSNIAPPRYENSVAPTAPHHSQPRPTPAMSMPRNEAIVTQQAEQHIYQRNSPHFSSNSHPTMEQRPPQVVRGSPQKHGLQDMLVPSIESPSSDPTVPSSSHVIERRDIHGRFERPQDSYPRTAVDDRRLSPARRQVIVVDDDSPPVKRRRMVREDDFGHFRPGTSRDYIVHASSPPVDSHFIQPSSVQPRDFPVRRPAIQSESSQGLLGDARSSHHSTGRIPIYDAPAPGSLARPPEHFRRDVDTTHREELPRFVREIRSPMPQRESVGEPVYRRPVNAVERGREVHSMRMPELDRGSRYVEPDYRVNVPQSSNLSLPQAVSRSYDMGPRPVVTEQALSHEFSQSRLEGSPSHTRDSFAISERPRQSFEGNLPRRYEDHQDRSFSAIPPARARSPVRYVERPMHHEEIRRPMVYGQNIPVYEERYDSPGQRPILVPISPPHHAPYGRPPPPRREIIALD